MPFVKDLLSQSKDGEWGKAEKFPHSVLMAVVRGTDFDAVRAGVYSDVPHRFIDLQNSERKRLQPWDIILETAGGSKDRPTGRTVLVTPSLLSRCSLPITCASFARFLRIDRNKAHPPYIFWLLQQLYRNGILFKYHTQHTGVARFQYTAFAEREPLTLPAMQVQCRIASILSAYDDLIENNARRIAILEEMTRRIYEEWFVKFRFPGHTTANESVLPCDWERRPLRELTSLINRGITPRYDPDANSRVINQKCIRDQHLDLDQARLQSKAVPAEKVLRFGDILINSTGVGTLGRVAQVYQALENCTVDTHVTIVRPTEGVDLDFFGLALMRLQSYFEAQGVGATGQTELGRARIAETIVILPTQTIQRQFGSEVRPARRLASVLASKNFNLRTQRDLLLPKLISGEIDISKTEEAAQEAAE